jgi:hypothetical protein
MSLMIKKFHFQMFLTKSKLKIESTEFLIWIS